MKRRRVCVVVASRANYGRIKTAMRAIKEHPDLELQLLVAASAVLQRFGNTLDVIRNDGFEPDATVHLIIEGENPTTMAKSTGLAIIELATAFDNMKPDVVVTVADRFETMATAVAASYMNIPLAHTQGGEISGSLDESVRHAITKLAHIHFPATELSKERLIRMGEDPSTIFMTGCPAMDIVAETRKTLDLERMMNTGGVGPTLDLRQGYFLVLQHPVTTEYGQGRRQVEETLHAIHDLGRPTLWLWPNVDAGSDDVSKGIRSFRETRQAQNVHFFKNFSPEDYVAIMSNSLCIVGNSSSGIREAAFLGVPCVNVGTRQSGRERGKNVMDVAYDRQEIKNAIQAQLAVKRYAPDHRFGDGTAGKKMADVLAVVKPSVQKRLSY